MSEQTALDQELAILHEALEKTYKHIVIEVGSKGFVSVEPSPDKLIIEVDPDRATNLDLGDFEDDQGTVIRVFDTLKNLPRELHEKADAVLCIAPSPRDSLEMAKEIEDFLTKKGVAIFVFDSSSNRRHETPKAISELETRYKGDKDYRIKKIQHISEDELGDHLSDLLESCGISETTVAPNSEIPLEDCTIVAIKRVR